MHPFKDIPTHIISGFLGAGKTTFIQALIENKPVTERWAVIVNEFGQVGLDAALLGDGQQDGSIAVKELPGGCACCALGPALTTQLNEVIKRLKPQRILIEPTGLGHPEGLLDKLSQPPFDLVLDMQPLITLLDPVMLEDQRVVEHQTFKDQLSIADVVALSKTDDLTHEQRTKGLSFAHSLFPPKQQVTTTADLQKNLAWLSPSDIHNEGLDAPAPRLSPSLVLFMPKPKKPLRYLNEDKSGSQPVFSCGWIFSPSDAFDYAKLEIFCEAQTSLLRLKAACCIGHAWVSINRVGDTQRVQPLAYNKDSRIEIISEQALDWDSIEKTLVGLIKN